MMQLIIYIHAGLGGVALLAGSVSMSSAKGGKVHKKAGRIFYFFLLSSILISFIVSLSPSHYNPFLFSIGVFSLYVLVGGKRALKYREKEYNFKVDKILSLIMILTSLGMVFVPLILNGQFDIVLMIFGSLGFSFSLIDFKGYRNPERLKKNYLKIHIRKIVGGYIASVTAFFVANTILPYNLANWLLPTLLGTGYIIFWSRKVSRNRRAKKAGKVQS